MRVLRDWIWSVSGPSAVLWHVQQPTRWVFEWGVTITNGSLVQCTENATIVKHGLRIRLWRWLRPHWQRSRPGRWLIVNIVSCRRVLDLLGGSILLLGSIVTNITVEVVIWLVRVAIMQTWLIAKCRAQWVKITPTQPQAPAVQGIGTE